MYSAIYRNSRLFWPGGFEMRRRLHFVERMQWRSREELQAWQLARIQRVVQYAYEHVPYYKELYQRLDIHPDDIKSIEDFQALPFLTRDDVNSHLDSLVSPELRARALPNSTGGSTGEPMRFFHENAFDWWDPALELRGRGWYGVREGEKIAWVWGSPRDMLDWDWKARLKARILQERYLNAYSMTEAKMTAFAKMLVRWQPAMFRGYASVLSLLAKHVEEHSIIGIRPKLIELTAEKTSEPERRLLERVFQCKVADWYSSREMGTIAFQCPDGGLHVCETRYLEIVANGRVAQPGQLGEVVLTSLHQFAMPFIRYKIGDMAAYEPDPCACGRGLPVLREVEGRLQDFLVTADGQYVYGGYFPHTLRLWPEISRLQVYQPDMTHLQVKLVCRQTVDSAWLDSVRDELQTRFGANMEISLQVVDSIPLTPAGKHRVIISDVKPDFV